MTEQRDGAAPRRRRAEHFASAREEAARESQRTWQVTPGYEQAAPTATPPSAGSQPAAGLHPSAAPQPETGTPQWPQGQMGVPGQWSQQAGVHFGQNQQPNQGYQPGQLNQGYQPNRTYQPNPPQWNPPPQGSSPFGPGYGQPILPEEQRGETEDSGRKGKVRHLLLMSLLIVAIAAAAAVGGYTAWQLWQDHQHQQLVAQTINPYSDRYVNGVYVDGIALGGLTQQEAWEKVSANANSLHGSWSVTLTYQGQTLRQLTSADLNMTVDVESTMRQAWSVGHTGDDEQRYEETLRAAEEPVQLYTTAPAANTAQLDAILTTLQNQMYVEVRDAQLLSFNPQNTNPFSFLPEVVGLQLDTASLKQELYQMISSSQSGTVELTPTEIQPRVTVQMLTEQYATLRGQASTPITSGSTENRNNNIRRAFELISGTRIDPGKEFSFNRVVGERTLANGFFEADEYVYNAVQSGVGGGVCQASSTVYLAAVRAGLEIVKREPHSMAVRYTDYGKDATVYWYSNHKIDLVFRNNTDQPIYIKAAMESDTKNRSKLVCKVYIYGASLGNVTYDLVTQETPIEPPTEPEYRRDKNAEYVTYTDQQKVVQEAAKGAMVDSWRVMYVDGAEVSREKLSTDEYKAKPQIIYVGTRTRN